MKPLHRRDFIQAAIAPAAIALLPSVAARAAPALAQTAGTRQFDVSTTVDLSETHGANRLYIPLFLTASADQRRIGLRWESDARVRIHRDRQTGAQLLYARWEDPRAPRKLTLVERIAIWPRGAGDTRISAAQRALWTAASPGLPIDGIVADTARAIAGGIGEPRAKLRAIYDWVIANTWRDPATPGCGTGDIAAMLQAHVGSGAAMGGKCADINSLMVGLCRAAGLPARDLYGIRLAPSQRFKSLGRGGGDITTAQHCRAEAWLDGHGWFPVDPADVRKVVLEEKLPVDSPPVMALADALFGGWEANWGGYNSATGIALPEAPHEPNFHFMMYVCAMGDGVVANCLDAAGFRYRITAAEITA